VPTVLHMSALFFRNGILTVKVEKRGEPYADPPLSDNHLRRICSAGFRELRITDVTIMNAQLLTIFRAVARSAAIRVELRLNMMLDEPSYDSLAEGLEQLRGHPTLSTLYISIKYATSRDDVDRCVAALALIPKLRSVTFDRCVSSVEPIVRLLETHPEMEDCSIDYAHELADGVGWTRMEKTVDEHWSVLTNEYYLCRRCRALFREVGRPSCIISRALERNWSIRAERLHDLVADLCLALLPLRLPAYVILWIVDWIPPHHHRFTQGADRNYDPRHMLKIRLIEGIAKLYDALRQ
jgi:hypothetical protein